MEYDPKLSTVAVYVKELLDAKGCTPEDSCVVLLDVITDLIVEYSKGDQDKLSRACTEWMRKILDEGIRKHVRKFPPPRFPGSLPPAPGRG